MAQHLSERLGHPFIVENRAGGNSNVATEAVIRARPDGYTLIQITVSNAINASLYENLTFDLIRDLAPIATFNSGPGVIEVNPSVPAETLPEFIAYAKANPGKINMATGPNGSPPQLYGELFKLMSGVEMASVPYRGSAPALIDLISGQVQVMIDPISSSIEHIRAGKLRPLGVTTAVRSDALPDVPAMGEFVPGYEASGWQGLAAPKDTPPEILDLLNSEINMALSDPKIISRLAGLGSTVLRRSRADFAHLIDDEIQKWAKVVKFAGIKPE
jgi:tripartite-type tricarboxylate transporter receptor subunit TctC